MALKRIDHIVLLGRHEELRLIPAKALRCPKFRTLTLSCPPERKDLLPGLEDEVRILEHSGRPDEEVGDRGEPWRVWEAPGRPWDTLGGS